MFQGTGIKLIFVFVLAMLTRVTVGQDDLDKLDEVDSINCNSVFPMGFSLPSGSQILDWDLSNYNANDDIFNNNTGGGTSGFGVAKFSYAAFIYSHGGKIYVGATYETVRRFRWVKEITTASQNDQFGAIKIYQMQTPFLASTDTFFQPLNKQGSHIYALYQSGDSSLQLAVFNYLQGETVSLYEIDMPYTVKQRAGLGSLDKAFLQVVQQSPQFYNFVDVTKLGCNYTDALGKVGPQIPSQPSCDLFSETNNNFTKKLHITVQLTDSSNTFHVLEYAAIFQTSGGQSIGIGNGNVTPLTYHYTLDEQIKLLNYDSADLYGKDLFRGAELLGVSTASAGGDLLAQIPKASSYDFNSFQCDEEADDYTGDLVIPTNTKIYTLPYQDCCHQQGLKHFKVYDVESVFTPKLLDSLKKAWQESVFQGWNNLNSYKTVRYYKATTFLKVTGNTTYTVSYAVFQQSLGYQEVKPLSYTFSQTGTKSGHAVSPDAPGVAMSFFDEGQTHLYVDDVSRAIVLHQQKAQKAKKNTIGYGQPENSCCSSLQHTDPLSPPLNGNCTDTVTICGYKRIPSVCNSTSSLPSLTYSDWIPLWEINKASLYEETVGFRKYTLSGDFAVVSLNTDQSQLIFKGQPGVHINCYLRTTLLLRDRTLNEYHVVQLSQPRPQSEYDKGISICTDATDASWTRYKYAFKYLKSDYTLHSKVFLNFGWQNQDQGVRGSSIHFFAINSNSQGTTTYIESNMNNCNAYSPTFLGTEIAPTSEQVQTSDFLPKDLNRRLEWEAVWQITALQSVSTFYVAEFKEEIIFDEEVCQGVLSILLMDRRVQDGILCIEVDDQSNQQRFISPAANVVFDMPYMSKVVDATHNLFPYSQCRDRSIVPYIKPGSAQVKGWQENFGFWFTGQVYDPQFYISRQNLNPYITINFENNYAFNNGNVDVLPASTNYLYFDFKSTKQFGLGYIKPVEFTFSLGPDLSTTWSQRLMLMKTCAPKTLVQQITQKQADQFPIEFVYYFGEGEQSFEFPQVVVTNQYMMDLGWNIDKMVYIDFDVHVMLNGTLLNQADPEFFWFYTKDGHLIVKVDEGTDQVAYIQLKALSKEPYYYIETQSRQIKQADIAVDTPVIFQIEFVNNLAPYFETNLREISVLLPMAKQIIIDLPIIIDNDSEQAYIESVSYSGFVGEIPCQRIVSISTNKNKIGNKIVIQKIDDIPTSSCEIGILLVDVMRVPRRSGYTFQIRFRDDFAGIDEDDEELLAASDGIFVGINSKLKMELDRVDQYGVVTFRFLIPMSSEVNPLYFSPIESRRRLNATEEDEKKKWPLISEQLLDMISLKHYKEDVIAQERAEMPEPGISVKDFNGIYLQLQLEFPDPSVLSKAQAIYRNHIQLKVTNVRYFLSANFEMSEESFWLFNFQLPPQASVTGSDSAESTVAKASLVMSGILTGSIFINFLLATSLNELWGQLNILQMVITIPLLQIDMPQNCLVFWSAIIQFAMFDLLDGGALTDAILGDEAFGEATGEARDEKFNLLTFDSQNYIYNLGTMFYIILFSYFSLFAALVFSCVPKAFCFCCKKLRTKIHKKLWKNLTPAFFIRLFIQSNFDLIISGFITLESAQLAETGWDFICVICAALGVVASLIVPLLSALVITALYCTDNLRNEKWLYWFGELYEPFMRRGSHNRLYCLMYNVIYMVRRFIMIFIVFHVQKIVSIQIGISMYLTILIAGNNWHNQPFFENPMLGVFDVMNEIWYYLILALSFGFTLYNTSDDSRLQTGKRANLLLAIMIGLNCLFVVVQQARQMYRLCLRNYQHTQQRKMARMMLERETEKQIELRYEEMQREKQRKEFEQVIKIAKGHRITKPPSQLFIIDEELLQEISEEENEAPRNMDRISDSPINQVQKKVSQIISPPTWQVPRGDISATESENVNRLIVEDGMTLIDLMGNDGAFESQTYERLNVQRSQFKVKSPQEYDWMLDEDRIQARKDSKEKAQALITEYKALN